MPPRINQNQKPNEVSVVRLENWHVTYETNKTKTTKLQISGKLKKEAKELITKWKSCPDCIVSSDTAGTMTRSKTFRIDLQGIHPKIKENFKEANIQVQLNATGSDLRKSKKKPNAKREPTTVSTVLLPCDRVVGSDIIKNALIIGLDKDKDIMFIRERTGVANGTRSLTKQRKISEDDQMQLK